LKIHLAANSSPSWVRKRAHPNNSQEQSRTVKNYAASLPLFTLPTALIRIAAARRYYPSIQNGSWAMLLLLVRRAAIFFFIVSIWALLTAALANAACL
jgi:hypothetical protein